MTAPLSLILLLVPAAFGSGNLLPSHLIMRLPGEGEPVEGRDGEQDRQQRSVDSPRGNPVCQEDYPALGASYSGEVNVTISGRTCQAWSASEPHEHSYTEVGEHNYCRNPQGGSEGVWCYTNDPDKRYELCSVPFCSATYDCQQGVPLGLTYVGSLNVTQNGRTCKSWSDTPYSWVGEHNFCRNPFGGRQGVLCFTTDPNMPIDYCSVPPCKPTYDCQEGDPLGVTYRGSMDVTSSGLQCQSWASTDYLTLGGGLGEHNHCRNPGGMSDGVLCATNDPCNPQKRWELCSVPICPKKSKVLDFSADNDNNGDGNCEYTSATL